MSTAEHALPFARRYVETRKELEQNTVEVLEALRTTSPLSEEFKAIWCKREDLYHQRQNQIAGLRFFPEADRLIILNHIEQADQ